MENLSKLLYCNFVALWKFPEEYRSIKQALFKLDLGAGYTHTCTIQHRYQFGENCLELDDYLCDKIRKILSFIIGAAREAI